MKKKKKGNKTREETKEKNDNIEELLSKEKDPDVIKEWIEL